MSKSAACANAEQAAAFQRELLAWYHANRRRLPWRETPSLYATVVSEFMLQQTQIKTALPYFERWLRELPDFPALAAAPEAKVVKLWEGLGYYTRARNLRRLACALLARPEIPREAAAWQELPGIGPYTSAAITSIAFGTPAACVDGNVVRILARLSADPTPFRDSATASKYFRPLAETLLNRKQPGDHNQAMMELGATLCTRHSPQCLLCPVGGFCKAREAGTPEAFPKLASKSVEQRRVVRLWSLNKAGLLLHRTDANSRRLAALLELPSAENLGLSEDNCAGLPLLATHARSITRFRYTEEIRSLRRPPAELPGGLVRIPVAELAEQTLSGPHRRWITALLSANGMQ